MQGTTSVSPAAAAIALTDVDDVVPPTASPAVLPYATPTPRVRSLRERVLRGSAWTLVGFGFSQVLRLASNVILTRFLEPKVFGIMALVLTFISGVNLFSELGLGAAIIRNPRGDDERFLNTAWTVQVGRGILIGLVLWALAYPTANYYHCPELRLYLPVCGLGAVIGSFNNTSIYSLSRHLAAGTVTAMALLMQVVSMAVTITWAVLHPSIWALIGGMLAGPLVYTVATHFLTDGNHPPRRIRNRFAWDKEAASDLFHFGKWTFVCTVLFFLQSQADRLVFGKLFDDLWWLGLYAIALQLVQLPTQVIGKLGSAMLQPALAKNAERIGSYHLGDSGDKIMEARRIILPAGVAATLAVALGAPLFFQMLYKPIYRPAGALTQFMVPGIWLAVLQLSVDWALPMSNQLRALALSNAVNLVCTVIGSIVGAKLYHLNGFVLGLAAGNLGGHAVVQLTFLRKGISLYRQDVAYTALVVVLGAIGVGVPRLFDSTPAVHQGLKLVLAVIIIGATSLWSARKVLKRG